MAATANGTTSWLDSFPSTLSPLTSAYTCAFWYFPLSAAVNSVPNHQAFSFVNTGGGTPALYNLSFAWSHSDVNTWKAWIHRQSNGTFKLAQIPFTPDHGKWIHLCATYDGTTVTLYYNGVAANSVAATNLSGSAGNPNIGFGAWNNGTSDFDPSPVAEATIWSTCLSADEVLSLSRGVPSSSVQASNRVYYNPLASITSTIGPNLTNHNSVAFNGTYFQDVSGGPAVGGIDFVATTTYGLTTSGGILLGGDETTAGTYMITLTGGMALGGSDLAALTRYGHIMDGGLALGGDGITTESHYSFVMGGGPAVGGKKAFPIVQPTSSGAIVL